MQSPKKSLLHRQRLGKQYRLQVKQRPRQANGKHRIHRATEKKALPQLRLGLYYWKDHRGREVDFVVKTAETAKQLIQVTYISTKNEVETRELDAFEISSSELKCENLLVITWDFEETISIGDKTVRFIPLWKWLLKSEQT